MTVLPEPGRRGASAEQIGQGESAEQSKPADAKKFAARKTLAMTVGTRVGDRQHVFLLVPEGWLGAVRMVG